MDTPQRASALASPSSGDMADGAGSGGAGDPGERYVGHERVKAL